MTFLTNERGSITLMVLVSCMFFLASVVCMRIYMQNKQVSVDREYKQVKASYNNSFQNIDEKYNKLLENEKLLVDFEDVEIDRATKRIIVKTSFKIENMDVKTLKYGWLYSANLIQNPSKGSISNWTFVESNIGENSIKSKLTYTENSGYYYLCFVINGQEYWIDEPISILDT